MVIVGDGITGSSSSHDDMALALANRHISTEKMDPIDDNNKETSMILDDETLGTDSSQLTSSSGK